MKEKSRILEAEGIVPPDAKRMAEDFNDQTLLNPRLKNTVGLNQRDNSKFYIYSFYIACSCEGSQAHFA